VIESVQIAIVGDRDLNFRPHTATDEAIAHAAAALALKVEPIWIGTEELSQNAGRELIDAHGLFIAPGSPYKNLAGALAAIRFAREKMRPLLGTCGAFST